MDSGFRGWSRLLEFVRLTAIGATKEQKARRDLSVHQPARSRQGVACPEREAKDRFRFVFELPALEGVRATSRVLIPTRFCVLDHSFSLHPSRFRHATPRTSA